ncbi:hypothetical protein [Winogradskya humida]|uniref:hypothetical protein n=1 Tax=Winogradskya humida TaxID=113566 RepID=UPI001943EEDE|nr:hypothetical protein [Actinoplanes humidus]
MTIPAQTLAAAATDPAAAAWTRIGHEAGADLLPWLARTCASFAIHDRETALALAGFTAVDASDEDRATYAGAIAALRELAVQGLPVASTDAIFVYLQQAILGFDGDDLWGHEPDHVNDGEVDVECPACDEGHLLDLTSDHSDIEPGLTSDLAVRLHTEAVQAGRHEVAATFTRLFGRFTCPECGVKSEVTASLAGVSA